ncbi:hypothetical protein C7H19_14240 [Aphanothece hegewaldii CCALA 016]|uniref:Uncharacterized protein n=1 Tax=Aphanothece hegewaldii CCALA 016 TaxID=2107694 RepID=A0A2T1LW69_9CHRO|nr:hypothetical protein [Aphanothece hegewaldii]PSF36154.1 hypothetical protein C7H19_14240 [Aphanothece hegewaldii CCALA 016]
MSLPNVLSKLQSKQSEIELQLLAADALHYTFEQKLLHTNCSKLTTQLEEVIEKFENYLEKIPLDDLYYRLAHLYLRQKNWQKADNILHQLDENFYYQTEALIYIALCRYKLGDKQVISKIAKQLSLEPEQDKFESRLVQEQKYNLLEMLVYACDDLSYEDLDPYFKHGSMKVYLILTNQRPHRWQSISDFRLKSLVQDIQDQQNCLIFDMREDKSLPKIEETQLPSATSNNKIRPTVVKSFFTLIAEKKTPLRSTILQALQNKYLDSNADEKGWESNLSRCKKIINDLLGDKNNIKCDRQENNEFVYRINCPYLIVKDLVQIK